jgi:hypothetical protein
MSDVNKTLEDTLANWDTPAPTPASTNPVLRVVDAAKSTEAAAAATTNATTTETPDPFDPANLRLDQSFVDTAGVKKLLTTVPVRRPNKQDFIRVHADPAYRMPCALIELKEERETYLLTPAISRELPGEFFIANIHTTINRQGVVSLWPVKTPGSDGKQSDWIRSAAEAAAMAVTRWIRLTPNMSLGAYEITVAESPIADPEWPKQSFRDLLKIGFGDRLVDRLDHPLIARLRGRM